MYQMEGTIRYSECAADNKIKLSAILNYFQDCTTENSERLGVGYVYLKEHHRAWLLNSWQVMIKRRPEVGEKVEICTWATGFKGVFGPRDFVMKTVDGEELVAAHSLWVYVDTESGRPIKPSEEEIAVYEVEEPLPVEVASRKINLPKTAVPVDTFAVRKYHIDTNSHMNNSKYVELACETLSEDFDVKELRVEYKRAAVLGNILDLRYEKEEERIVMGLCDKEGTPYAIVEFIGETK